MIGARSKLVLAAALGINTLAFVGCRPAHHTQRVFDGRTVNGPYIESEAYAAYAEGAYLEARAEWVGAEQAYRRALHRDPGSPSIWTRLGAIACRTSLKRALDAFKTGLAAEEYAPGWAERARCLHRHGEKQLALESAQRCIALDAANAEANLLIAEIYREQGQSPRSRAWLFAWLLHNPEASSHWNRLSEQVKLLGDPALAGLAHAELNRRAGLGGTDLPPAIAQGDAAGAAESNVMAAIDARDLAAAQSAAAEAKITGLDLAIIATRRGEPELALSQAELILAADPHNGDAWVVALLSAALAGKEARLGELLRQAKHQRLLGAERAELLTELLRWRVGDDEAAAWKAAYGQTHTRPAPKPR